MLEMISLVFFGFLVYAFLVLIPSIVENVSSESFRISYFKYLASKYINSFGK